MAIAVTSQQIGLRIVQMADGSTGLVTERGEILASQIGVQINSKPGHETTIQVEFVVDGDRLKFTDPSVTPESLSGEHFRKRMEESNEAVEQLRAIGKKQEGS